MSKQCPLMKDPEEIKKSMGEWLKTYEAYVNENEHGWVDDESEG